MRWPTAARNFNEKNSEKNTKCKKGSLPTNNYGELGFRVFRCPSPHKFGNPKNKSANAPLWCAKSCITALQTALYLQDPVRASLMIRVRMAKSATGANLIVSDAAEHDQGLGIVGACTILKKLYGRIKYVVTSKPYKFIGILIIMQTSYIYTAFEHDNQNPYEYIWFLR